MNALRTVRHRAAHLVGVAWRLTKAHYGWILTVLSLLLGAIGLYVTLHPERSLTQEEQRLVDAVPPKVGLALPSLYRDLLAQHHTLDQRGRRV
ncbi:MAG: hypothetical protein QOI84_175 [Solirubrobacterales bacterium]|nr:hypothetical protein [Solirubrobacterales bacterium]